MSAVYEDGHGESTGIFPEEIWGIVLGYLENSEDILNVLRAFPVLDKAFQRKKSFWLFDQVLPHLMTTRFQVKTKKDSMEIKFSLKKGWIQSHELAKLRRVSKRWKKAVDKSLESNADLLLPYPLQSADINIKQIENTLESFPSSRKFRKLLLTSGSSPSEISIIDLVEMLADTQVETVTLEGLFLTENAVATEIPMKQATRITSLCISDNSDLTYAFLWWLPNLRVLTIHFHKDLAKYEYGQSKKEEFIQNLHVESRLRRYCLKAYNKTLRIPGNYSIWEEFPSLEILRGSVEIQKNSSFSRVQYTKECGNKAFFGWK